MTPQARTKLEQIARMSIAGIPFSDIAIQLQMSYSGLMRIRYSPEYAEVYKELTTSLFSKMDLTLDERTKLQRTKNNEQDSLRREASGAVPDALKVVIEHVRQKKDLRAALALLKLDPDKTLTEQANHSSQTSEAALPHDVLSVAQKNAGATRDILNAQPERTQTNEQPPVLLTPAEA